MTRLGPQRTAAPEERLPYQFSNSTIQHITHAMAARMLHVVHQVAHGNVSQAIVEAARALRWDIKERQRGVNRRSEAGKAVWAARRAAGRKQHPNSLKNMNGPWRQRSTG